mmetsp:Transcript_76566/g.206281  ORF Transcript_76566/g.206281 Transcript_76566/m.206281 type:complete len:222 (-) Transcript_76566:407-1072(-)
MRARQARRLRHGRGAEPAQAAARDVRHAGLRRPRGAQPPPHGRHRGGRHARQGRIRPARGHLVAGGHDLRVPVRLHAFPEPGPQDDAAADDARHLRVPLALLGRHLQRRQGLHHPGADARPRGPTDRQGLPRRPLDRRGARAGAAPAARARLDPRHAHDPQGEAARRSAAHVPGADHVQAHALRGGAGQRPHQGRGQRLRHLLRGHHRRRQPLRDLQLVGA